MVSAGDIYGRERPGTSQDAGAPPYSCTSAQTPGKRFTAVEKLNFTFIHIGFSKRTTQGNGA